MGLCWHEVNSSHSRNPRYSIFRLHILEITFVSLLAGPRNRSQICSKTARNVPVAAVTFNRELNRLKTNYRNEKLAFFIVISGNISVIV